MSTNEKDVEKISAKTITFNGINTRVAKLGTAYDAEAAVGQTPAVRVVQIYAAIKPLLVALSATPFIPKTWQSAIALFTGALDALAAGVAGLDPDFKAGKDL